MLISKTVNEPMVEEKDAGYICQDIRSQDLLWCLHCYDTFPASQLKIDHVGNQQGCGSENHPNCDGAGFGIDIYMADSEFAVDNMEDVKRAQRIAELGGNPRTHHLDEDGKLVKNPTLFDKWGGLIPEYLTSESRAFFEDPKFQVMAGAVEYISPGYASTCESLYDYDVWNMFHTCRLDKDGKEDYDDMSPTNDLDLPLTTTLEHWEVFDLEWEYARDAKSQPLSALPDIMKAAVLYSIDKCTPELEKLVGRYALLDDTSIQKIKYASYRPCTDEERSFNNEYSTTRYVEIDFVVEAADGTLSHLRDHWHITQIDTGAPEADQPSEVLLGCQKVMLESLKKAGL